MCEACSYISLRRKWRKKTLLFLPHIPPFRESPCLSIREVSRQLTPLEEQKLQCMRFSSPVNSTAHDLPFLISSHGGERELRRKSCFTYKRPVIFLSWSSSSISPISLFIEFLRRIVLASLGLLDFSSSLLYLSLSLYIHIYVYQG